MGRKEKTLVKIRQNPGHVAFRDLDNVLRWYGFEGRQPSGGSSHTIYKLRVAGRNYRLTVPYHRPFVKRYYVKEMLSILEELDALGLGFDD